MRTFSPSDSRGATHRLLSGALAVVLAVVLLAAAVHVHHDAQEAENCALCTIAHTPVVQAPAAPILSPIDVTFSYVESSPDRRPEVPQEFCISPRAPPIT
jgi:hypothetical protein